jgi:hypothetical protein
MPAFQRASNQNYYWDCRFHHNAEHRNDCFWRDSPHSPSPGHWLLMSKGAKSTPRYLKARAMPLGEKPAYLPYCLSHQPFIRHLVLADHQH